MDETNGISVEEVAPELQVWLSQSIDFISNHGGGKGMPYELESGEYAR